LFAIRTGRIDARERVPGNAILRLTHDSLVERFDDGVLLFSERQQQLSRLDGASLLLVPLLEHGTNVPQLTAELERNGVPADAAREWTISLLHRLAGLSVLSADDGEQTCRSSRQQSLRLGPLFVRLIYSGDDVASRIEPLFRHLECEAGEGRTAISVAEFGAGLARIGEDGVQAILVPADELAVRVKGMLVERMFSDGSVAALHAALLSKGGRGILLLGSPGSGKSTLALALMHHGYAYGSDDVTLVNADGSVTGVALAPGVKEGSWKIAEALECRLTPLPAHVRPDGQRTRFVELGKDRLVPTSRVETIMTLRRNSDAASRMQPMRSEETLAELLRESRASGGRCSVETITALSGLVKGAAGFELHYAEAMQAADLIAAAREP
jgi:hypothetical protein